MILSATLSNSICLWRHGEPRLDCILLTMCIFPKPCGSTMLMPLGTKNVQWLVQSKEGGIAYAKRNWSLVWNKVQKVKDQDCTGSHSDVVCAAKYVDSKFQVYCSCPNKLILWMPLTICWYPSVSYYFSWTYPLLLQWKSPCSSTVFLCRFSTSHCDDQMAKIFDKGLSYFGPALRGGWTRWPLEIPSNLN